MDYSQSNKKHDKPIGNNILRVQNDNSKQLELVIESLNQKLQTMQISINEKDQQIHEDQQIIVDINQQLNGKDDDIQKLEERLKHYDTDYKQLKLNDGKARKENKLLKKAVEELKQKSYDSQVKTNAEKKRSKTTRISDI